MEQCDLYGNNTACDTTTVYVHWVRYTLCFGGFVSAARCIVHLKSTRHGVVPQVRRTETGVTCVSKRVHACSSSSRIILMTKAVHV